MPLRGSVTAATVQGPRSHQEDRYVVAPLPAGAGRGHLLAALDGHGGTEAAEVCARAIPALFRLPDPDGAGAALTALVADLDRLTRGLRSGTTVSVACVLEERALAAVAVLGDSPVVVVGRDGSVVVGPEHNVRSNPGERRAAEARGGVYAAGYVRNPETGYGLQLARALGDAGMGEIPGRDPDLFRVELGPGSAVVLMTDGVLDPAHEGGPELIADLLALQGAPGGMTAGSVIGWAEGRGLRDNATAVVWAQASG